MEEKGLVKQMEVKLPAFVENAYQTLEGMKEFSNMLLESKLLPLHFYEKGGDGKPDYTKGKTSSVTLVLLQAQQLEIPPMTALQHIIPVNGLLSIKGDLAKTMIFASGKLKKDSWKEEITGTIENENMVVSITATRADNGMTLTRSFSVDKAKRAGLWITQQQINGQDGWKYKASAWYKFPERMITYRALGFIARDLFADVLNNMYITEEAMDLPKETAEVIETPDGGKIVIPDKQFSQERSGNMTQRAADKIKSPKFDAVPDKKEQIQEATVVEEEKKPDPPFVPQRGSSEQFQGVMTHSETQNVGQEDEPELKEGQLSIKEMEEMSTKSLLEIINKDTNMIEAMETIPGKNTNKKLREIISAFQQGKLMELVAPYVTNEVGATVDTETGEIKPNTGFDKQNGETLKGADVLLQGANKYSLAVPEFDKGNEREFSSMKKLFNALAGVTPPIDNNRWIEIAGKIGVYPEKYKSREDFARYASVKEVNDLLNAN